MARELFEDDAKSDFAKKKKKKRKKNDDDDENDDVAEQIARAKLESSRRAKFVNAAENELCEPSREGPEVNFPSSKEEYEELRQRRKSVDANLAEHDHQKKDDEDEDVMKNKEEEESERKEKEEKAITKWVQSYDKTQQNFYYFNPITRETTWEAPNDENAKIVKDESAVAEHKKRTLLASVSKEELEEIEREVRGKMGADDKNDNERLPDPSTSAAPQMVWEYEDDSGNWQGPFTMEQLQTWRAALPMNLKVRQCGNTNASEYTSLAILLGDVHLRKKCEELGAVLPLRCTAVEAEQVMMAAIAARDRIVKENLNGLASDHDNDDDAEEEGEGNEHSTSTEFGLSSKRCVVLAGRRYDCGREQGCGHDGMGTSSDGTSRGSVVRFERTRVEHRIRYGYCGRCDTATITCFTYNHRSTSSNLCQDDQGWLGQEE